MGKILVTGASGFIGEALCATLQRNDINFTPVFRRSVEQYPQSIIFEDMHQFTDWRVALKGVDSIVHLAARVHVMHDQSSDPLAEFRAVNVEATLNLARQAVLCGVKRFVFVSSVKVNGEETTDNPYTAFDMPAPIDPYGISKMEAEHALRALSEASGLEVVIVRPPLVYGPGVRANFLRMMKAVKVGVPLPLGAIHNRRSMVALDNLVDLLIVCSQHPAASGQTIMVSDDNDVSTSELLRMLASAMGRRSRLLPFPAGLIESAAALFGKSAVASRLLSSLQVDIRYTKFILGWKPVVSMQEAVNQTVEHFLAQH